ncbi:MAG: DnaA ATPase domain-containing protein, partial [Putridiphycobacter sp.]
MESELSDQEINTWLRTLHGTQHDDVLVLLAPNTFVYQHVKDHHLDSIKQHISHLANPNNIQVVLQIGAGDTLPFTTQDSISSEDTHNAANHDSTKNIESTVNGSIEPSINEKSFTNNLNTTMKFENFVEGKSNQLAVASALQVGENPGQSYNPLFIYGGVGLGKTHLMHSIGNKIRENNNNAKVVYLHS